MFLSVPSFPPTNFHVLLLKNLQRLILACTEDSWLPNPGLHRILEPASPLHHSDCPCSFLQLFLLCSCHRPPFKPPRHSISCSGCFLRDLACPVPLPCLYLVSVVNCPYRRKFNSPIVPGPLGTHHCGRPAWLQSSSIYWGCFLQLDQLSGTC